MSRVPVKFTEGQGRVKLKTSVAQDRRNATQAQREASSGQGKRSVRQAQAKYGKVKPDSHQQQRSERGLRTIAALLR